MKDNYFIGFDILKFIFSLFIIAIHVNLIDLSGDLNWYIVKCLFRLAVPSFFVISGFLYEMKIASLNNDEKKIASKNYIKCLIIPLLFWLIVDTPFKFLEMQKYLSLSKTISEMIKWLFFYQWGGLWYISALIVSILLINVLRKRISIYKIFCISIPLYLFALISNNYYFLVEKTFIGKIVLKYREIFISERNGIFEGIIFVTLGIIVYNYFFNNKINYKKCGTLLVVSYIVFIIEVFSIKGNRYLEDGSLYISFIFLMPLLIIYFTKFKTKNINILLRKFSTGFYFLHYPIIRIIDLIFLRLNFKISSFLYYIIVVIISSIIILTAHFIDNKRVNRIIF